MAPAAAPVFGEPRPTAFIPKCPAGAKTRMGNRGSTKFIGRATLEDGTGEKFFVSGMEDEYTVIVSQRPSCSCPDAFVPCKHLVSLLSNQARLASFANQHHNEQIFVYLDVLHVAPTKAIWWQTSFLRSELVSLLPSLSSQKRALEAALPASTESGSEAGPSDSNKRPRTDTPSPPITTDGLDVESVRFLLLTAFRAHREEVTRVVESLRPTILDGLSESNLRNVLVEVGGEFEDVREAVKRRKLERGEVVISFAGEKEQASEIIHSLDRLRESQKYERAGDLDEPLSNVYNNIYSKVISHAFPATKSKAVKALLSIGAECLEAQGEVGKHFRMHGLIDLASTVGKILGSMGEEERAMLIDFIKIFNGRYESEEFGELLEEYGEGDGEGEGGDD